MRLSTRNQLQGTVSWPWSRWTWRIPARGPRRVNPVGLSLVRVLSVDGTTVRFAGVDVLDGTPVLDLKPYVTRFDSPAGEVRCGWFDDVELVDGSTPEGLSGQAG